MLDHFGSGINSDQTCKWGIEWATCAPGLSCCFASERTLHSDGHDQRMSVSVVAPPIKTAYRELLTANEYFYDLSDKDLLNLIVQVTGSEADSSTTKLTLSTIKTLKQFADFESKPPAELPKLMKNENGQEHAPKNDGQRLGINLAYTINLNLPATSDQAVFNAIFRTLKEYLLSNAE